MSLNWHERCAALLRDLIDYGPQDGPAMRKKWARIYPWWSIIYSDLHDLEKMGLVDSLMRMPSPQGWPRGREYHVTEEGRWMLRGFEETARLGWWARWRDRAARLP